MRLRSRVPIEDTSVVGVAGVTLHFALLRSFGRNERPVDLLWMLSRKSTGKPCSSLARVFPELAKLGRV